MSVPLPDRPDLEQLRRQAKELCAAVARGEPAAEARVESQLPGRATAPVTLAIAQWVMARERGFASWSQLKRAVEQARRPVAPEAEFLAASVDDDADAAQKLLERDPALGHRSIWAAAVLGDADFVALRLRDDPEAALAVDELRGWPPLLYLCYSQWHRLDPSRSAAMVATAEILLDAGASPNTNNGRGPFRGYRSALHGSVTRANTALALLLLDRGADADDRLSLVAAAGNGDHETLRALLEHGAVANYDWALDTASSAGDAEAVAVFLDVARRQSAPRAAVVATSLLGVAAQRPSGQVVATLLAFGADPNGAPGEMPPFRLAVRVGGDEAAHLLLEAGADNVATPVDHLLGACAQGDRAAAQALVAAHPGIVGQLADADQAVLVDLASGPDVEPVALMLDLGFPVTARNDIQETPLHAAAYGGRAATVALLLAHGADLEARDPRFDATPLAFATVGSGERPNPDGDWPQTVRLLLEAGASKSGVWLSSDKAPSAEVVEVLRAYGVRPEDDPHADLPEPTGTLRDLAQAIREAYDTSDLDRFATLLDPDVTWGGGSMGCTNRQQVIAWYRMLAERGAQGSVSRIVELDEHTLLAEIHFSAPAAGTSQPPPDSTFQRLEVTAGRISAITGHATLDDARRFRPPPAGS